MPATEIALRGEPTPKARDSGWCASGASGRVASPWQPAQTLEVESQRDQPATAWS